MEKIYISSVLKNEKGEVFNIAIKIPVSNGWIDQVYFNADEYCIPLEYKKTSGGYAIFANKVSLETRAIYHYYFNYNIEGKKYSTEKKKLSSNFKVPSWTSGKIMYHIFVDRFKRGNTDKPEKMPDRYLYSSFNEELKAGIIDGKWNIDYYGGDLKGIVSKLDYIKQLGASILYLSPIVYSQSNHRYDAADYENVDPYLGNNNDLKNLCDEAHKKGLKVVLDAVFNHTGNDSKYFNEYNRFNDAGAFQSKESKYYDFYKKNNGNFCYWWGMKNMPECDSNSKSWINYITGVNGIIDKWFSLGIDGLRLDVADNLSDEYIEHIRKAVKRNKEDGFILGEVWYSPISNRGYLKSGKGMDSVMNYYFIDALIRYFKYGEVEKLKKVIENIINNYPDETINSLMNFTSTHDISRAINIFGSDEFEKSSEWAWNLKNNDLNYCKDRILNEKEKKYGKEVLKAYLFVLTFFPGILSIFYGDEIGIEGLGNLYNRKPFIEDKKDLDLLNYFKHIGDIRNNNLFLRKAKLTICDINENFFSFERENGNNSAFVLVNRGPNAIINPYPIDGKGDIYRLNNSTSEILTPHGGLAIVKKNKNRGIK